MKIKVQTEDFDVSEEIKLLRQDFPQVGAVAVFVGTVRDLNQGSHIDSMEIEHYPGMTEKSLEEILEKAKSRWALQNVTIIHRVGLLKPLDQIVLVATASAHRGDAFAACEFIMDYLKSLAPFWKKEAASEGTRWVDANAADQERFGRWDA